jgi:hypothetical protein
MIIGKYAVSPMHVHLGSKRFDPDTNMYEIAIYLGDDSILTQWVTRLDDADKMMRDIDDCIGQAEQAQRDVIAAGGADD